MQLFFKGIVLLAAMIFVSCPGKPAAVSGLTIDRTELNLKLGQEQTVNASVLPGEADEKGIRWTSDAPQTVSVAGGRIRGVLPGTATVTAETVDGGFRQQCRVTVADEVYIPDPLFRSYLFSLFGENSDTGENQIDLDADGIITLKEAEAVTVIHCYKLSNTPSEEKIADLTGLEYFVNLEELACHYNKIESLDLRSLSKLRRLYCFDNRLRELDLSGNPLLTEVSCGGNALKQLSLEANPFLVTVDAGECRLEELDLTGLPELEYLVCSQNRLRSLDVSRNPKLIHLSCYNNYMDRLDARNCPNLDFLWCGQQINEAEGMYNLKLSLYLPRSLWDRWESDETWGKPGSDGYPAETANTWVTLIKE